MMATELTMVTAAVSSVNNAAPHSNCYARPAKPQTGFEQETTAVTQCSECLVTMITKRDADHLTEQEIQLWCGDYV